MMDDLISRQAAIDALRTCYDTETVTMDNGDEYINYGDAIGEIEQLPSAQPEIIRCNDCKHWTQTTGNMCGFGLGDCDYINAKLVNCNGFCYWAERKTDG